MALRPESWTWIWIVDCGSSTCPLLGTMATNGTGATYTHAHNNSHGSNGNSTSVNTNTSTTTSFEVFVSQDTFKFNAAHFVAFQGYRERLHGHNYRVGVRLLGQRQIGADGYLIDFGNVKKITKQVCKRLNEHFLCPMYSNVLTITTSPPDLSESSSSSSSVHIECSVDGSKFVFPAGDCAMLPIAHATAEELAIYLYAEILNGLNAGYLLQRGIHTMEVTVAEAVGQEAVFRLEIPKAKDPATTAANDGDGDKDTTPFHLDVRQFIASGRVVPMPCLPDDSTPPSPTKTSTESCSGLTICQCPTHSTLYSEQLTRLALAINDGSLEAGSGGEPVTVSRIQELLQRPGIGSSN